MAGTKDKADEGKSQPLSATPAMVTAAPRIIAALLAEAVSALPRECCGILLGGGTTVTAIMPAHNVHPSPETHFEIDPQALVDAHRAERSGGPQVVGYYHSHPRGPACPSATDRAGAAGDGRIWAIAVPPHDVTFWRDDEQGFSALPLAPNDA